MTSPNYTSLDNSLKLSHHISVFIFIALFSISQVLSETDLGKLNGECKLSIKDDRSICTKCNFNCIDPQSVDIILSDCVEFKGNCTPIITCNDVISRRNSVCKVSLEISHISQHDDLVEKNKCGDMKINYLFTFKSIKLNNDLKDDFRIFNNLETLVYDVVNLKDSDLNLTKTKNLLDSLDRMKELTLTDIVSSTPLQFNYEMKSLKKLTISGGTYLGIPKGSFFLGRKVISSVELRGVNLVNNKINTGSFIIDACEPCGGSTPKMVNITLDRMDLTSEMLEKDPIEIDLNSCSKQGGCSSLKIYLMLRENLLARKVPESNFAKLFETNYNLTKVDFILNYDEIDCCAADNRWLFRLNKNSSKVSTNIDVGCIDLPMKFNEFSNETDLITKCDKRNVFPIILIAVLSCLLLIVLFATFGFICLFYVIPRQGQAIVLDSKGRKLDKLSSETAANSSDLSSLNSDCLDDNMVVRKVVPTIEKKTFSKDHSPQDAAINKIDRGEKLAKKTFNSIKQANPRLKSHKTVTEKATNYNLPKFSLKLSVKKSSKLNRHKKRKKRSGFDSKDLLKTGKGKHKKQGSVDTLRTDAVQKHLPIGSSSHSHTKPRDLTKTVRNSPIAESAKTKTVAKDRPSKTGNKSVQKLTNSKSSTPASDATKSIPQQTKTAPAQAQAPTAASASASASATPPATIKQSEDDVPEGMSLVLRTIDE